MKYSCIYHSFVTARSSGTLDTEKSGSFVGFDRLLVQATRASRVSAPSPVVVKFLLLVSQNRFDVDQYHPVDLCHRVECGVPLEPRPPHHNFDRVADKLLYLVFPLRDQMTWCDHECISLIWLSRRRQDESYGRGSLSHSNSVCQDPSTAPVVVSAAELCPQRSIIFNEQTTMQGPQLVWIQRRLDGRWLWRFGTRVGQDT